MMLFTVGVLHHAYDRWLDTQLQTGSDGERDGWLIAEPWLYSRRAPGNTVSLPSKSLESGSGSLSSLGLR